MREIIGKIIAANKYFHMFKKNDSIAVGVSGGKDSLVLWKALDIFCKKINNEKKWNLKIKAFHVKINFQKIDYSVLIEFAKKNKLELEFLDSNVAEVLLKKMENDKIQCSLCSKMKKAILIKAMKKQKFTKLALGHHADDAIETFFLNILNEGRIATLKPNTFLDRNEITLIRPLIFCREKEIKKISDKLKLPIINNLCPNENKTQRSYIKYFIDKNFYHSIHWPNSYKNIFHSLLNKKNSFLWFNKQTKS